MNEYLAAFIALSRDHGRLGERVLRTRAATDALIEQGWHGYCGLTGCTR